MSLAYDRYIRQQDHIAAAAILRIAREKRDKKEK
jgi:hypothetical protein